MSIFDLFKPKVKTSPTLANNEPNLIRKCYFKVSGVTFDNRQDILKKIVKNAIRKKYIEPFDGMTNKEIIEYGDSVFEAQYVRVPSLRLEPTTYKNKDAIEVYIRGFDDEKEYMVGYVEKDHILDVLEILEILHNNPDYELKADSYFTGGKVKDIEYDYDDKPYIDVKELNYGIDVILEVYDKKKN